MVDKEDSASLPPADDPPLTEEELDAIKSAIWERNLHASYRRKASVTVDRLIADLRASRERIRELEEDLKGKMTRQEWYEDYARW